MRTMLLFLIVLCPAIGAANALWLGSELRGFVERVKVIESAMQLEEFKRIVARQMYGALAQIVVLAAPLLIFLYGVMSGALGPGDIVYVLVPSFAILALGLFFKQTEHAAQNIPIADPELARQRADIVATWLKKPLPDW